MSNFSKYLYNFLQKEKDENRPYTNTRIAEKSENIYGGSFHIPTQEYDEFLAIYKREIVDKGLPEYLTEVQFENGGPILVDFDLRFPLECTERHYDSDCIDDIVSLYATELYKIYQFDESSSYKVFVLEKPKTNPVPTKNVTKDGIHLIIGISSERSVQILLRKQILTKIGNMLEHIPIINTWDDVLDKGITDGGNNWQMYGSCKPLHDTYKLTTVYTISYNDSGEINSAIQRVNCNEISQITPYFEQLSARYTKHPSFFYTSAFMRILEETPNLKENKRGNNRTVTVNNMKTGGLSNNSASLHAAVIRVKNADELIALRDAWLDSINTSEYILLRETYEYVMALPPSFYESGSYNNWMRVGWALRNTDDRLFIVWVLMSAQSNAFSYSDILDMYEDWVKFDENNPRGLKKESIMFWVKEHSPQKYADIRLNSVDYKIDHCLGKIEIMPTDSKDKRRERSGCGDYDIADVLYTLKKSEYVCVSVKNNIWYRYEGTYWLECDSGTTLRKSISTELRDIYSRKASKYMEIKARLTESQDADQIKRVDTYIDKLLEIVNRLGKTNDKKNIMTESRDMFWDPYFLEKLDSNPYLLCFKNGVIDMREKVFRKGTPDDYLSKCTRYDYVPLNTTLHQPIIDEINTFMHQILPVPELYEYVWDHLASALLGTAGSQKFHMLIGAGSNGKSVLMTLMDKVLGDYFATVSLSIITGQRAKVGGTSPELVVLKGVRYAVIQEPNTNERINVGIMKNLTSGIDPIQARGLYAPAPVTFIPQFKLVLCSNEFMQITAQDHGTWRRIGVVDFMSKFTDNPVTNDPSTPYQFKTDYTLVDRLDGWKQVMAAMLVKRVFETEGALPKCAMVDASSDSYRERQDYVAEFISDKLILDPHGSVTKLALIQEFTSWFSSTYGRGGPNPKDVQAYFDRKFTKCLKTKGWLGIRINTHYDTDSLTEEDVNSVKTSEI